MRTLVATRGSTRKWSCLYKKKRVPGEVIDKYPLLKSAPFLDRYPLPPFHANLENPNPRHRKINCLDNFQNRIPTETKVGAKIVDTYCKIWS